MAPDAPIQTSTAAKAWRYKGFIVNPLADFSLQAEVLSEHHYSHDKEARISPLDLALGWGQMSDTKVIDHLNISQSGRWYFYHWSTRTPPIPQTRIISQSSNMHIIPSSPAVKRLLEGVRRGDIVKISGLLVAVDDQHGWHWRSSLSRTDTGDGACELVWVRHAEIVLKNP